MHFMYITSAHSAARARNSTFTPGRPSSGKGDSIVARVAKHWEKEHSRTKGNIPPAIEMKLTISQDEKDYFKRGQMAKKKRRAATGHGSSGSKGAKKQKKGKGKGKGKGKSK